MDEKTIKSIIEEVSGLCWEKYSQSPDNPAFEYVKNVKTVLIGILTSNQKVTALPLPTSRGSSAGSSDVARSLDSADKPRNVGADAESEKLRQELFINQSLISFLSNQWDMIVRGKFCYHLMLSEPVSLCIYKIAEIICAEHNSILERDKKIEAEHNSSQDCDKKNRIGISYSRS